MVADTGGAAWAGSAFANEELPVRRGPPDPGKTPSKRNGARCTV